MSPSSRSRPEEVKDWAAEDQRVIKEFRENEGRVERFKWDGEVVLLLHHQGAKTGTWRISPLAAMPVGNNYAIFGTKGGSPKTPAWYHNLVAHPRATVEIATESFEVVARLTSGEERARLWEEHTQHLPGYADLEQKVDRVIPVFMLERV